MKLGAISFMTDTSIAPGEIATALEQAGFESFWAGDHSHIPADPHGGPPLDSRTGVPVPDEYLHLLDPFQALATAAAATSTLKLATGICLVNERDPIHTAKQVATLDHLSGGRFVFGVGGGWNAEEMANHGYDVAHRWPALRERIEAMTAIWTNDVAEYHGEHVDFGPVHAWPKPAVKPPVLIGGNRLNIKRVVAYADGWCPATPQLSDEQVHEQASELRQAAAEAGRASVSFTAFNVTSVLDLTPDSPRALTRRRFDVLAAAGAERAVVVVPPQRDACLRMIEHYAATLLS